MAADMSSPMKGFDPAYAVTLSGEETTAEDIVYDAFISYSHAKDKAVASALQSAMQWLGKPWYRRRSLRLFRDDTSLTATPHLWPSIEQALGQSRFLILMASPEAAASPWVDKEVTTWLGKHGPDTVLIALADGELDWDASEGDFRWSKVTPLPPSLTRQFTHEPRWIDLRPYREGASPRDAHFTDLAADFAAALHGRPKDDLLSQEVRQQRRALRLAGLAVALLIVLLTLAGWQWQVARLQTREAQRQRNDVAEAPKADLQGVFRWQRFGPTGHLPQSRAHRLGSAAMRSQSSPIEMSCGRGKAVCRRTLTDNS